MKNMPPSVYVERGSDLGDHRRRNGGLDHTAVLNVNAGSQDQQPEVQPPPRPLAVGGLQGQPCGDLSAGRVQYRPDEATDAEVGSQYDAQPERPVRPLPCRRHADQPIQSKHPCSHIAGRYRASGPPRGLPTAGSTIRGTAGSIRTTRSISSRPGTPETDTSRRALPGRFFRTRAPSCRVVRGGLSFLHRGAPLFRVQRLFLPTELLDPAYVLR